MSGHTRTLAVFLAVCSIASGQRPAEETVKTLKGPEGYEVTLFAAEPLIVNPTSLDIDSRGRVWVAEGLNYRFFANKQFQRVPQADKIKILDDTDGDGRADKVTVFAEDIYPVPMGLAIQEIWKNGKYAGCRVFTGNSPDLLCLEDTDGDDKADKRYALLSGFGGKDSDHGVHGMFLAADGRLYFTQGDGKYGGGGDIKLPPGATMDVTSKTGERIVNFREGTVLRCDLNGGRLELLAQGLRNDYEVAVDSFGNVFASDNDDDGNRGCRTCWIIPGADYGYHTPGSTRHWAEENPRNTPKFVGTGNGSPCGIAVYEGDMLPENVRGSVLQVDAGSKQINLHPLTRVGSGFRTEYKVLISGDDPLFRPVDCTTAADGSLYVADWYDAGVGGHRFTDQKTGRVYRLASKGHKPANPKPDFGSVDGLIAALLSPNVTTSVAAAHALVENPPTADALLSALSKQTKPHLRARVLQTLLRYPKEIQAKAIAAAGSDPAALEVLLRARALEPKNSTDTPLAKFAANKPYLKNSTANAAACREALLACRGRNDLDDEIRALVRVWDGVDRFYLSAMRLGLQSLSTEAKTTMFLELASECSAPPEGEMPLPPYYPTDGNDSFPRPADRSPPASMVSKLIGIAWALESVEALPALQQIAIAYPSPTLDRGMQLVIGRINDPKAADVLLAAYKAPSADALRKRAILATLAERMRGPWKNLRNEDRIVSLVSEALSDSATRTAALRAIASIDPTTSNDALFKATHARIQKILLDDKADLSEREAALLVLFRKKDSEASKFARKELDACRGKQVASPLALATLSAMIERGKVHEFDATLLDVIRDDHQKSRLPIDLRRRAAQVLASETIGARRLMDVHRVRKFPEEVLSDIRYLLNNHADRSVRQRAAKEMPMPAVKGRKLHDARALLAMSADTECGKSVFFADATNACGKCHRVQGVGQWVGPDLSGIGIKYGAPELLYHVLHPSGAIAFGYQNWTIQLDDGRVLSGLIVEESPDRVVLKTATGDRLNLATSQIERRTAQPVSLMPEKLTDAITDQQLADLVAYMATLRKPVAEAGEFSVSEVLGKDAPSSSAKSWTKMTGGRDGVLDLAGLLTSDPDGPSILIRLTVDSSLEQQAKFVVDCGPPVSLLDDNKPIAAGPSNGTVKEFQTRLKRGVNQIVFRIASGPGKPMFAVSAVADSPLRFASDPASVASK